MSDTNAQKQKLLEEGLQQGMVQVLVDARIPGVQLPEHLMGQLYVRLNLSYHFVPPDLEMSEWGVRCTLSFSGARFRVALPWKAMFAAASLVSEKVLWMASPEAAKPQEQGSTQRSPRHLKLVN